MTMITDFPQELLTIAADIAAIGGKCYLVGGAVRDVVLGLNPKDLDIEVFGLQPDILADFLEPYGKVQADVGKSFSVIKLYTKDNDYDFAMPRREKKIGRGYKGFEVEIDPFMDPQEAASRRDYTFNALMYDLGTGEMLDFFGGEEDIRNGIIRHIGPAFAEDPLRVLRGFQFAGRFNFVVDPKTAEMCYSLLGEYDTFPAERIWGEWYKWATKSVSPGAGLQFLVDTGWIEAYPALQNLMDTPQDPEWHPEGDVFIHTQHVVDAAMDIARREEAQGLERATLMFAALCHDIGKHATTVFDRGRYRSPGHGVEGIDTAVDFLTSIGALNKIIEKVPPLMAEHLSYIDAKKLPAIRRLSYRLKPACIAELILLIEADHSGRPPKPKQLPETAIRLMEIADEDGILFSPPKKLVTGKMLISSGLVKPGPGMGKIIAEAYQIQLKCKINTKRDAENWIRDRFYRPIITGGTLLAHGLAIQGIEMGRILKATKAAQEAGLFDNEEDGLLWVEEFLG
jgi:tRNA nucleotidyltransferase (CCA-adding enzyme)